MRRWGRRGSMQWQYEVLISLLLLALCGYAMFEFIASNAKGEGFFSRYHAADLASIEQIAASPQGDTIIRYDNIRDDLDLGFWFTDGEVAVGTPRRLAQRAGATGEDHQAILPAAFERPTGAAVARFAPTGDFRSASFDRPTMIIVTRQGGVLTAQDLPTAGDACAASGAPSVPIAEARAWIEVTGTVTESEREETRAAFAQTLASARIGLARDAQDATITVRLTRAVGTVTTLDARPGSPDVGAVACDLARQLSILAATDVAFNSPSAVDGPFVVDATLTTDNEDRITPTQLGRAAAYAIARRYGG